MKRVLPIWLFAFLVLSSCSLLQRQDEEVVDDGAPPFDPKETAQNIDPEGAATTPAAPSSSMESEVSRLNTKVSALETKLEVLTASLERNQARATQPVIEAQSRPQPSMAAPVEEEFSSQTPQSASSADSVEIHPAAAEKTTVLPVAMKGGGESSSGSERDFQSAMELFQGGKNLEAASGFALFAKKYPRHLMASHALYWAGEASARAQQWSLAQENWEELEKNYPRSAYMPEALAGLARAYDQQGNATKAQSYRDTLSRAFPKSPIVVSMHSTHVDAAPVSRSRVQAPAAAAPAEEIPSFESNTDEETVGE